MSSRIPLRKRLLVRLMITSVLIALCSVAATAWLAVQTTTRAIQEEQGQVLADDTDILRQLSGYAATHPSWAGVQDTVRRLSAATGRRIALTTADRTPIADSARSRTALPPGAAATVDPLHTDTYSEPGAQLSGVDPRRGALPADASGAGSAGQDGDCAAEVRRAQRRRHHDHLDAER